MPDLFASAKAVLRRANHHITDLGEAINAFGQDKPYTLVVEYDPHYGKHLLKAKFGEEFSEDIACILFDAINNLRSCLDQMTFAIAIKHRGVSKNWAYFPFCKDAAHWANRINGMKNDLPPEVRAIFERFKPYKGGNNTLWALDYIANLKKHAGLVRPGFGAGSMFKLPLGMATPEFVVVHKDRATTNEIILFVAPDPNSIPQINFRYTIVLDDPEDIIQGQSPVALINSIGREVGIILWDTEQECRRIGLIS